MMMMDTKLGRDRRADPGLDEAEELDELRGRGTLSDLPSPRRRGEWSPWLCRCEHVISRPLLRMPKVGAILMNDVLLAFAVKLPLALAVFLLVAYAGTINQRISGRPLHLPDPQRRRHHREPRPDRGGGCDLSAGDLQLRSVRRRDVVPARAAAGRRGAAAHGGALSPRADVERRLACRRVRADAVSPCAARAARSCSRAHRCSRSRSCSHAGRRKPHRRM